MSNCIAVLATMDTKGEECDFLRQQIETLGGTAMLIDFGVVGETTISVDVSKEKIAALGGSSLAKLVDHPSREIASEVMVAGAIWVRRLTVEPLGPTEQCPESSD